MSFQVQSGKQINDCFLTEHKVWLPKNVSEMHSAEPTVHNLKVIMEKKSGRFACNQRVSIRLEKLNFKIGGETL